MRSKAMQSLTNDIRARCPGVTIWGKGDLSHQDHPSDHNEDDTAGSSPAQSDPDNIPEHRAIDVMIDGVYITDAQIQAIIDEILANPHDLARLKYINYKNWQWSASTGWGNGHDNSDDPHPTHAHFSGLASKDDDDAPWLTTRGDDVFCKQGDPVGTGKVTVLQANLNTVLEYLGITPLLVLDDDYGSKTAKALLDAGCGNAANNGSIYWAGETIALENKLREIAATKAMKAHLADTDHGGSLPDDVQLTIPAYTVPAQTIRVPIEP